ncbi:MAG: wax ester/triacylglycerol synthase domain-containing protein [Sporichthyaceae bacterium]
MNEDVWGAAAPTLWGGGPHEAMTALETLMWRVEERSTMRNTCVGVELLDGTPEWNDVLAAHHALVARAPRLRHRVVVPPGGVAPPRWTPHGDFDLGFHVRRTRLATGTPAELTTAIEHTAMSGFDRARPPWLAILFEGLPDGRSAYVMKVHHSMSDGLGLLALFALLHGGDPSSPTNMPYLPVWDLDEPEIGTIGALALEVVDNVKATPGRVARFATGAFNTIKNPGPALAGGTEYVQSLRRVLTPPRCEPSPLLSARSTTWRFAMIDVDFPVLKAAGKSVGASLNDAFLAALLGGYRRYHEVMGEPVDAVPVTIPVATRTDSGALGGNAFAPARLVGPVASVVDPGKRMLEIRAQVQAARAEPALNHVNHLAPLAARLPGTVIGHVGPGLLAGSDLQASNVPGSPHAQYLGGVQVTRMYGLAPNPGVPAMITLATHGDTACIGVNFDPAAFYEPELFVNCLLVGFNEVLALSGTDVEAKRFA